MKHDGKANLRYVRLDWKEVTLRRLRLGLDDEMLKEKAAISKRTWERIEKEQPVQIRTAQKVAHALAVFDLMEIYHEETQRLLRQLENPDGWASDPTELPDWEKHTRWSPPMSMSNGLRYELWQLKHRHEKRHFVRGKRYLISECSVKDQRLMKNYLTRHGDICNKLQDCAQIPRHHTTVPDPGRMAWWILDEWIDGRTLAQVLEHRDRLAGKGTENKLSVKLPHVMREIALALQSLHQAGVIRRELSPRFVLLKDTDDSVVLTDFELGKLLDGSPSVGPDEWPDDLYRAPEVQGRKLTKDDFNVDVYSWGRILVRAATGCLPPRGEEGAMLDAVDLPPQVRDMAKKCVSPVCYDRPQSINAVLKAIRRWK